MQINFVHFEAIQQLKGLLQIMDQENQVFLMDNVPMVIVNALKLENVIKYARIVNIEMDISLNI